MSAYLHVVAFQAEEIDLRIFYGFGWEEIERQMVVQMEGYISPEILAEATQERSVTDIFVDEYLVDCRDYAYRRCDIEIPEAAMIEYLGSLGYKIDGPYHLVEHIAGCSYLDIPSIDI